MGAGSRWDWKPLVCGLHVGGSGMMVTGVWGGAADLSGSPLHGPHCSPHTRRGLEKVA